MHLTADASGSHIHLPFGSDDLALTISMDVNDENVAVSYIDDGGDSAKTLATHALNINGSPLRFAGWVAELFYRVRSTYSSIPVTQ